MTVDSLTLVVQSPFHNLLPLSFSWESTACLRSHTGPLSGSAFRRSRGYGMRTHLLTGVLGLLSPCLCVFGARLGRGGEVRRRSWASAYCAYRKLFLCGTFTIMKFELRSEESRTIIISLASVCVWLSTVVALDDIEMFLCLLEVLCQAIASFHPLVLVQRSNPSFHSLDFMLVPKRT